MGNTCKPMAVLFQCMTKFTTNKLINKLKKNKKVKTLRPRVANKLRLIRKKRDRACLIQYQTTPKKFRSCGKAQERHLVLLHVTHQKLVVFCVFLFLNCEFTIFTYFSLGKLNLYGFGFSHHLDITVSLLGKEMFLSDFSWASRRCS